MSDAARAAVVCQLIRVQRGARGGADSFALSMESVSPRGACVWGWLLQVEEELVDARVLVELGMEGEGELFALARGDNAAIDG